MTLPSFKTLMFIRLLPNLGSPYCKAAMGYSGICVVLLARQFFQVFDPISILCDTGVISYMLHYFVFIYLIFKIFLYFLFIKNSDVR